MNGQIDLQDKIIKTARSSLREGTEFCITCNEKQHCIGCRLHYMLLALNDFINNF